MYGVHITFNDGSKPFCRFHMTRREYNSEMKRWERQYQLKIENVVEEEGLMGDRLIFALGLKKTDDSEKKNTEVSKSRARYYSRTNG